MELKDEREIAAAPEVVWAALLDADVLRRCVPGCTQMEGSPEAGFTATVVQKVGPVKATFLGEVTLSAMTPPQSLTITGAGKGGPAGFASGGADVVLTPNGAGTTLAYVVNAKVGGKMAQLGSRIIDGFARKMADQFFDDFKAVVEGVDAADAPAPDAPEAEKKGWVKRLIGSKD
ncbi:CoxG family protein [Loktanella sp. M215]|uniref:CoxG family protein n=1 Tax=Loktanella sp. M215 TaxID=2675431 RepID=UPI001F4282CF|nr:carbon monoxide dehydrogenase subunit G [Loktanella sp. M215]MCF7700374.1 carbon monoxide dehydrogenase [Loktanella sp. M215]MCF7701128.1 carbon monoxide dehydrogenase [Loktanella sp. M215]